MENVANWQRINSVIQTQRANEQRVANALDACRVRIKVYNLDVDDHITFLKFFGT